MHACNPRIHNDIREYVGVIWFVLYLFQLLLIIFTQ